MPRIPLRDVVIFTRQFATMVNAGMPLAKALDVLSTHTEHPALASVVRRVVRDVESGRALADALAAHRTVFSELYVNMVAAGESGGILDTILGRLATFLERSDALTRKVRSAMIYPAVIVSVAIVAVVVLLMVVVPVLQGMFASAGLALPLPTRVIIALSVAVQDRWWMLALSIAGAVMAMRTWSATRRGRFTVDRLLLSVPILGDLVRKAAIARVTRTLGTLLGAGVSILDGLEITAQTSGNRVIQAAITQARASIIGGATIAAPLARSGVFPPMVLSMIAIGEQAGSLDEMLRKIADFYDGEVDVAVSGLLALMEPALIVALGVVVGGIVVAMYLPIFDMMNVVQE